MSSPALSMTEAAKKMILVVEDEQDISELIRFNLEHERFAVTTVCPTAAPRTACAVGRKAISGPVRPTSFRSDSMLSTGFARRP